MKIVKNPEEAFAQVDHWRQEEMRIGLVPTMGALHEGHLSLVRRSQKDCDVTAVTLFVNPTQFGPNEDFSKYPRPLDEDLMLLQQLGVDLVFAPQREKLYPPGFSSYVGPPKCAEPLEGVCRPGHFRGVTTIVLKLFQILPATHAFFGQKDFQQLLVIKHMTRDFNLPIRVVGCPTVRESDGLAMSSRNRYLDPQGRHAALALWRALGAAQSLVNSGTDDVAVLEKAMHDELTGCVDRVDYARVVDRDELAGMEKINKPAVALIAAYVGKTRLIDNLELSV